MNLKTMIYYKKFINIYICLTLSGQLILSSAPQQDGTIIQNIPLETIVDPSESQDADFSFYNDPYLIKSNNEESFINLIESGITQNSSDEKNDSKPAILNKEESLDVDFTFFNDPYAFEKYNDIPIKAKFGGYVQYSSWWDNRQGVSSGEGYVLLFPKPKLFDVDCKDINARGEYNAGFLETRMRGEFFGPIVLGAESYAYIETDFFGSAIVANRLRLRHAFMKFTWNPSEILLGQFWNPAFEVRCYPLTLDFAAGIPNAAFARNPQIRYRYAGNNKEFILAATSQIDFVNNGPIGPSSTYMRNSRIPMLYARGAYDTETIYAGICIGFERIIPRLQSTKGYKVNESLNSAIALAFAKVIFGDLEIRQNIIFAQNANNLSLLGGYAVTNINPTTDQRSYTNISSLTYWIDINLTQKIEPGLFIGIAKNLGARKEITPCIKNPATGLEENTVYGQGTNINTIFKVCPRIRFHVLPVDFAGELEIIRTSYGCLNENAQVKNRDPVTGIRLLLTTYYYF